MPTIQVKANVSSTELLDAVEQLPLPDLEEFLDRVLALRAKRVAPTLASEEAALLTKINAGIPERIQTRFDELRQLQTVRELAPEEETELFELVNQIETIEAQRIEYLAQLAQLHGKSVRAVMAELNITPPSHA
ncbi:MAG: STAS/SEC14 domain-containing protein [Chloroflexi bacterium]|nr:STAS/SEC14 domain-containing protein [Chloroflexota bacterium]